MSHVLARGSSSEETSSESRPGEARPGVAFALLGAVQIVLILTITLITVALPAIQGELRLSRADLALLSAAYGLSFSGLLLLGGCLADLLGRRRVFTLGVAVFGLASAVAAFAPGFEMLLAARFAQGVGAALAAPAAMALLGAAYPEPERRERALAVWGTLAPIGAIGGTLLGGVIVAWVSWRWAFVIPVVVATVAVFAAPRLLPSGPPPVRTRLDVPGALLATVGISALSYGLVATGDYPSSSATVLVPLLSGAALLIAFVGVESRTREPLMPLSYFASPLRSTAWLAVLLGAAGTTTLTFFLALYFQQVRDLSPLATSAAFLPYGLALLATGLLSGRLVGRFGARAITASGLLLAAVGLGLLGRMSVDSPYVGAMLAGLLVFPIGVGLTFSGATVAGVEGVPEEQAGLAGGVVNTALESGPTIGLALLVSVASAYTARLGSAGLNQPEATTGGYAFALGIAALAFAFLAAGFAFVASSRRRETPKQAR